MRSRKSSRGRYSRLIKSISAAALGVALLGGCAATDPEGTNDPVEGLNRKFFDFNNSLDNNIFEPVSRGYVDYVPEPSRRVVHNLLNFLRTPAIFANAVLQGNVDRAGLTLSRFITNGTIGVAGMVDVAGNSGVPYHEEDFGQTLAVWGLGEGPYLMVPLFGPTNIRDGAGTLVDSFLDPMGLFVTTSFVEGLARTGANALDKRSDLLDTLDDLERTSLDYYAAIRSLYRQRRNDLISNGASDKPVPIPNISLEEESAPQVRQTGEKPVR